MDQEEVHHVRYSIDPQQKLRLAIAHLREVVEKGEQFAEVFAVRRDPWLMIASIFLMKRVTHEALPRDEGSALSPTPSLRG